MVVAYQALDSNIIQRHIGGMLRDKAGTLEALSSSIHNSKCVLDDLRRSAPLARSSEGIQIVLFVLARW
eukprot:CAMPEP_0177433980 /NCGR_PEP_ID=MMETSP0369-20130122/140_1 /TAXON_ID=447022 ORGANISM="Scrippsiella hangoei-like, Strain SHHI-4" /NCGR_SAMPLE_ID=MMETSP0369 /ASSEMBLY_ACC=CAM_ASM_000364 /LENGTH=68 /DNA_ID=CAMNT_0018904775 /DNA_START=321 /DNA_END=524 /DNA_ORIENTATION=-